MKNWNHIDEFAQKKASELIQKLLQGEELSMEEQQLLEKIKRSSQERSHENVQVHSSSVKSLAKRRLLVWTAVAALVCICIRGLMFLVEENDQTIAQVSAHHTILPGKIQGTLTTESGETYALTDSIFKDLSAQGVSAQKGVLVYNDVDTIKEHIHTLKIPRGGEYRLSLSDGTIVYLNSETTLRFPTKFIGKTRDVYLSSGEAYFEVAHNADKKFIVHTDKADIRVYGTKFNVKNYADEEELVTTLVQGKIGLNVSEDKEFFLNPGQQANVTNQTVNIKTVNVMDYISWVEQRFSFNQETLGDIMKSLARWYDFEVVFESADLKNIRLSGSLGKYENIEDFLFLFERVAPLTFNIENNLIVIKRK